jgi:hypothetical protein
MCLHHTLNKSREVLLQNKRYLLPGTRPTHEEPDNETRQARRKPHLPQNRDRIFAKLGFVVSS